MTTEEINKLSNLDTEIRKYTRFIECILNYSIKIGFYGTGNEIILINESNLVRKQDIRDTIYACVKDTLDDLEKKKENLVLCIKEENTTYKPIEL